LNRRAVAHTQTFLELKWHRIRFFMQRLRVWQKLPERASSVDAFHGGSPLCRYSNQVGATVRHSSSTRVVHYVYGCQPRFMIKKILLYRRIRITPGPAGRGCVVYVLGQRWKCRARGRGYVGSPEPCNAIQEIQVPSYDRDRSTATAGIHRRPSREPGEFTSEHAQS
jgi:hypothetical protein